MDVAASEFYDKEAKVYDLGKWYPQAERDANPGLKMNVDQFIVFFEELIKDFPNIVTIEDPFDQDDFEAWIKLTAKVREVNLSVMSIASCLSATSVVFHACVGVSCMGGGIASLMCVLFADRSQGADCGGRLDSDQPGARAEGD